MRIGVLAGSGVDNAGRAKTLGDWDVIRNLGFYRPLVSKALLPVAAFFTI
jgi:hypothetical protein